MTKDTAHGLISCIQIAYKAMEINQSQEYKALLVVDNAYVRVSLYKERVSFSPYGRYAASLVTCSWKKERGVGGWLGKHFFLERGETQALVVEALLAEVTRAAERLKE